MLVFNYSKILEPLNWDQLPAIKISGKRRERTKMLNKLINSILLLAAMAFGVSGGIVAADAIDNITPVTDEMLENPSDSDWLMWRRTYDGWGYSPLDQINKGD